MSNFNDNANGIAVSLMEDVRKGRLRKTTIIEAMFEYMSDEQIFDMAVKEGFICPDLDEAKEDRILYDDLSAQDKIIEKILARHGGS